MPLLSFYTQEKREVAAAGVLAHIHAGGLKPPGSVKDSPVRPLADHGAA